MRAGCSMLRSVSHQTRIKISRGTHLMHLESMRLALWRESINFLAGDDVAPVP